MKPTQMKGDKYYCLNWKPDRIYFPNALVYV